MSSRITSTLGRRELIRHVVFASKENLIPASVSEFVGYRGSSKMEMDKNINICAEMLVSERALATLGAHTRMPVRCAREGRKLVRCVWTPRPVKKAPPALAAGA